MDGLTNIQTMSFMATCAIVGVLLLGVVWAFAAFAGRDR